MGAGEKKLRSLILRSHKEIWVIPAINQMLLRAKNFLIMDSTSSRNELILINKHLDKASFVLGYFNIAVFL